MTQTTTGNLRHLRAASRRQRSQHQRRRVADAARGMLIHADAVNRGQIDHAARLHHFHRQAGRFLRVHALEADRHHQRGKLIIRNRAVCRALREIANFLLGKLAALFFLDNDIHHIHISVPPLVSLFPVLSSTVPVSFHKAGYTPDLCWACGRPSFPPHNRISKRANVPLRHCTAPS